MERIKRGFTFWILVMLAMALPSAAQTQVKKALYLAKITVGVQGKGSATIVESASGYQFMVATHAYPNQQVTKVSLWSNDWSGAGGSEIVLCELGTAVPCTYDADGNVFLDDRIVASHFVGTNVTGAMFRNALRDGTLGIFLNDGTLGAGTFERIL